MPPANAIFSSALTRASRLPWAAASTTLSDAALLASRHVATAAAHVAHVEHDDRHADRGLQREEQALHAAAARPPPRRPTTAGSPGAAP